VGRRTGTKKPKSKTTILGDKIDFIPLKGFLSILSPVFWFYEIQNHPAGRDDLAGQ